MKANYDAIAEQWQKVRERYGLPPKDLSLFDAFIGHLPRDAKILDLGCGHGLPIARMLVDKGFQLTGIDQSEKQLEAARQNIPEASFTQAEMEDYQINDQYDGIVIWDSIFHIPRKEHRPILEKAFNALNRGGVLILSSGGDKDRDSGAFTDFMFGVEFFYDAFPIKQLLPLCADIGYSVIKQAMVNEPDGGRDKGRFAAVLQKTR